MKEKTGLKLTIAIFLIIILCSCIIAPMIISEQKKEAKTKKNSPRTLEWTEGPEQLLFVESGEETEGSLCMVFDKEYDTPLYFVAFSEYINFTSGKIQEHFSSVKGGYVWKKEKYTLDFYNYRTGEIEKSLDLVTIAEEYTPGKQYSDSLIDVKVIDGKRYLKWQVRSIEDPSNFDLIEDIVYDFDEDKVTDDILFEEDTYTEEEKEYLKSFYILCDNQCNFLEVNGFTPRDADSSEGGRGIEIDYISNWDSGMIKVNILVSKLPEKCDKLYQEFPELAEYKSKSGGVAQLCLADYPNAEEVMEMLIEDDSEITFEGCILDSMGAIDGKEHEISSVDDYIKWRDWGRVADFF